MTEKKPFKSILTLIAKYLLGVGIVVWVFIYGRNLQIPDLKAIFQWKWILLLLGLKGIHYFFIVLRWHFILRKLNIDVSARQVAFSSMIGVGMNYVLPGGVSGDAIKAVAINENLNSLKRVFVSIVFDRVIGLMSVVLLICIQMFGLFWLDRAAFDRFALLLDGKKLTLLLAVGTIGLITVLGVGYKFRKHTKIQKLIENSKQFLAGHFWVGSLFFSLMAQLTMVTFLYVIGRILDLNITYLACMFMFTFASFIVNLPLTPGGLGVGQASYNFLMTLYMGDATLAGASMYTVRQFFDLFYACIGLSFLLYRLILRRKKVPNPTIN